MLKVTFTWERDNTGYQAYAIVRNYRFLLFESNDPDFFYEQFRELSVKTNFDYKDLYLHVEK